MATKSFYPNIGTLVTIDNFPEELQFLENGLQNVLDKIYYKELQYVQSNDASQGYYNIVLVTGEQLKLDLFGSGFSIVINPGSAGETLIPLTLNYNWPVLALISNFNLETFSYVPAELQNILNQTLNLSDSDLVQTAVGVFEGNQDLQAYKNLVDKINLHYGLSGSNLIPYPVEDDSLNMAEDIRLAVEANVSITDDIQEVINQAYILSGNNSTYTDNLNTLAQSVTGESIQDYIKKIIVPKIEASLGLSVGLAFPRNILLPVDNSGNAIPEPEQSILVFDVGNLDFSTQGGINFQEEMAVSLNHPSQIGSTGLGIDIVKAKLDLSKNKNILEADLDGRPQNFMGVYAQYAAITLPSKWFNNVNNTTLRIAGYNMLVGTGGISGTIGLEAVNGTPTTSDDYLYADMGSWRIGFNSFDITFKQNDVISSNIRAQLDIPRFTDSNGNGAKIDVLGHIDANGDFLLTAAAVPPFDPTLTLPNVFKLHLKSVELGKEDGKLFIGASADVEFLGFLGDLLKGQTLSISTLRIYSDGHIDFRVNGGNLTLPKPIKIPIGPVDVSVTAIHFGSHEREKEGVIRKYNYFGFDGGVSIGIAGVDARGDGIKYYYTIDDGPGKSHDAYLHIQTIYVDMVIPANSSDPNVAIKGWLSIPEPGEFQEYKGGVSLKVKNPRIAGGVDMRLAPKYPGFLIDANIELPNPIPLGPVSIFGFRGLLGYRYVAEKEAIGMTSQNTWYQYYTAPQRGVNVNKFSRPDQTEHYSFPFSLGVGALLGDTVANGSIISANAMLLLSLPSMVMVDARMKLLSKRVTFTDDPPFFAFFIFGDNSLEFGFGADYKFPESSGDIIKIYAEIQAGFFFNNPSAWYINFGTQQAPISAKLLKDLFTLKAFLMISGKGIQAGARGEFRFDRKFGPVSIFVLAYLELGGKISFQKPQMGAYFEAGLAIDINVKIIRIYAAVTILLAVESPRPFMIYGAFTVEFKVKILFFKLKFKAKIELKWEFNKDVDRTPVNPFTEVPEQVEGLVKGISMLTNETFDLLQVNAASADNLNPNTIHNVVPLDTYIDIKTTKGLLPAAATNAVIGGFTNPADYYVDLVPPDKVMKGLELRQVKHQYTLENIEIKAHNGSGWINYNPFKAIEPANSLLDNLKAGQWQKKDNQYNAIRLLATTPFTYTEQGNPGWFIPEQYGVNASTLFCEGQHVENSVSDFLDQPLNTLYYASTNNFFQSKGASYQISGDVQYTVNPDGSITMQGDSAKVSDAINSYGFIQSLEFKNHSKLTIMLPAPSTDIELKLSTYSSGVTVAFYSPIIDDSQSFVQYDITEKYYYRDELINPVTAPGGLQNGITKIVITPDVADSVAINLILEQMAQLMDQGYQDALAHGGIIDDVKPSNPDLYNELVKQLQELQSQGCGGKSRQEKYEIVCKIFPDLVRYYNNNFFLPFNTKGVSPGVEQYNYVQLIRENIEAGIFEEVFNILASAGIPSSLFELYVKQYYDYLKNLKEYLDQNPDNLEEIVGRFNNLRTKFKQINNLLKNMNPCEDGKLCNLSDSLSYQEFGEFSPKPPVSRSPLLETLYKFIEENPEYNYLYEILHRQIATLETIIKEGWGTYNHFKVIFDNACKEIISTLADLGNCSANKSCFTLFHEIKWLSVEDYAYNISIPSQGAITQDTQAAVDAITKSIQPIWRPDTSYFVRFKLKDTVDNGQGQQTFDYAYAFRTGGPLGFFHLDKDSTYGDIPVANSSHILEDTVGIIRDTNGNVVQNDLTPHPDLYPHTSLRAYIDYQRSYPNADGNIVNAKPLFYDDVTTKISMYFTSSYVSKLLDGWEDYQGLGKLGGTMKIIIKDPVEGVSIVNPPRLDTTEQNIQLSQVDIPQTIEEWSQDDNPAIPPVLNQYFNMLNSGENCTGIVTLVKPKSFYRIVTPKRLKPQKLYTAQVLNFYWGKDQQVNISQITEDLKLRYAKEVHKFVFQTSRYKDFNEQVQSCFIPYFDENGDEATKQAVYKIEKSITADELEAAWNVIQGVSNPLSEAIALQYQHPFDRILQGLFGISPLEDAPTTEFNKIVDPVTGNVVALLIRNPEPFNHPKIPLEYINRSINNKYGMIDVMKIAAGGGKPAVDQNYKVIYSKDYAQAIVMNAGKSITAEELNFQFVYRVWNGTIYEISDSRIVYNIKIN
ncbi:hypothetical protein [Chryseobacterium proteolyticum]|uniref:hypothetical protein n=1 Tax=Chryseobacterium proteolyticum TaxID=118127 RepID=UPI003983502F